jgi:Gpi18-like mannosyltransferase
MELATNEAVPAARPRTPLWSAVVLPFVASRVGLVLVAWTSRIFASNVSGGRGWSVFPQRAVDAWARWDSGWYLSIVLNGYERGPLDPGAQHSVAFFPAYPAIVAALHALLPASARGIGAATLTAILVSNAFAVGALWLLYLYARDRLDDPGGAERAVLYLLAFPGAFFLSAALTESLFLFLAIAAVLSARHRRWARSGAAAFCLGLTRPNGVAMMLPLAWIYLEQRAWRWREVRWDAVLVFMPAAGFAA